MKTPLAIIVVALCAMFAGCNTAPQVAYYEAIKAQAEAKTTVMSEAVKSEVPGVALAAVIANALEARQSLIAPPESGFDTFLKVFGTVAPTFIQGYSVYANTELGKTNSNNAVKIEGDRVGGFVGIAKLIQAPGAITNTDRHDVYTPAPVVVTPPAPVVVTPVVQVVPIAPK